MIATKAKEPDKVKAEAPGQKAQQQPASPQEPTFNPLWQQLVLGVQAKLAVSAPDDPYEREADRVAEQVMRIPDRPSRSDKLSFSSVHASTTQRKCVACEEEEEKLQRKESGSAIGSPAAVPRLVHEVLNSSGQPLDSASRGFFEPRFQRNFGDVRVHADAQAEAATRSISARAFTLGRNLAFAAGEYAPGSERGRRLLAHELVHVVQQSRPESGTNDMTIRRACLPQSQCEKAQEGSAVKASEEFRKETASKRAEQRQRPLQQVISGSHGKLASQADRLFRENLKELYSLVHGVFIDETLTPQAGASDQVGASIEGCKDWAGQHLPPNAPVPQFEGAKHRCVFVSKELEQEADKFYNTSEPTLGGKPRDDWRIDILGRFTHEATHERFLEKALHGQFPEVKFPTPPQGDETCVLEFANGAPIGLAREISELAAEIGEFPLHRQVSDLKSTETLGRWFKDKLTNEGESISGTIREIRCSCACTDADAFIRAAFELASLKWTEEEKTAFHLQMKRGFGADYNVYWPYELPPRVGKVGRHELSLDLGVGFTGSNKLAVAMLTYRYVLSQWAAGRLRLTAGAQVNPGALLTSPHGEFGAGTLGLHLISTSESVERKFGGFTARLDTGLGISEFLLKPETPGGTETTGVRGDYILRVGAGIQFFIPGLTSLTPASLEAAYRLTQPLDVEARRIHTFGLTLSFPFPD